jgi:hypothetical protein
VKSVNSLDAIFAMCVLLSSFSILLGVINIEKAQIEESINGLNSKTHAQNCATIFDSMFTNDAKEYNEELDCGVKNNEITYTTQGQTKSAKSIAKVEKKETLKVETSEHYKS